MRKTIWLALAALAAGAGPAVAQAWDTPMFLSPRPGEDIGLYGVKPDGVDWGVLGIWRQEGNPNLGIRAGLADGGTGDTQFLVGAEAYGPLLRGRGLPVQVAWVLGAGATFSGDATWLRIPLGVSIGGTLDAGGLVIVPYVLPRAALDVIAIDDLTDTELNLVADLGADILLGGFKLRVGASFGEVDSFGAGIAIPFGRRVAVEPG